MTETAFDGPGPEAVFQQGLEQGRLCIQKCNGCGSHIFYPRLLCPNCGSAKLETMVATGHGRVYSTTIVRQRPEAGGDYNISIVELAEGPHMMTRVVDVEPGDVRIDMAVDAFVGDVAGNRVVLFRPSGVGDV